MTLLARLTRKDTLNQYASVIEQILMSGSNMLASIVVLKLGSVSQFGVYSFVYVLSTLIAGVFGTLLHRQMMLQIASEDQATRQRIFLATIAVELIGLLGFIVLLSGLMALLSIWFNVQAYASIAVAGGFHVVLMVLFDACKQYSYTTENQVYSLRSTATYVIIQLLMMALIFASVPGETLVESIYGALCAGFAGSLLANRLCRNALRDAQWTQWSDAWAVLSGYFRQGRFSLLGMAITWAQNQSMNPFLMLISGPTVAGYFSLGRLMIMPMAVASQGLVNSSTPTLRRLYNQQGAQPMSACINTFILKTSLFSVLYTALLLAGHLSGVFARIVPGYAEVQWFLALWIVLVSCSIWRFWRGQFFVVSMQFKFLLRVSIAALCVTATGMFVFGILMRSFQLALFSVIAGELVAIALYRRQRGLP